MTEMMPSSAASLDHAILLLDQVLAVLRSKGCTHFQVVSGAAGNSAGVEESGAEIPREQPPKTNSKSKVKSKPAKAQSQHSATEAEDPIHKALLLVGCHHHTPPILQHLCRACNKQT